MLRKRTVFFLLLIVAAFLLAFERGACGQGGRDGGGGRRERDGGPSDRPPRGFGPAPPRGFGPAPPRGFGPPRGSEQPRESSSQHTIKNGFVFIDGEYVPPPYELRYADEQVTINGRELKCKPPALQMFGRGFGGGPPRGEFRRSDPGREIVTSLVNHLGNNAGEAAVVIVADQPLFPLDTGATYELLSSLLSVEGRALKRNAVRERLPEDFDKSVWDQWIDNYELPAELEHPAAVMVANYDQRQEDAQTQIRARQWRDSLRYPLEVSAMVMSVLAIGHLLGGRPHAGQSSRGMDPSPAMVRALNWSLLFATVFSSYDLVWTLVTTNSMEVKELNPVASQFIHDPRHLAGFKIAVTFSCLALIWLLRRHKRAQVAAWWVCLVLTMLVCRWLLVSAFLSMGA